MQIYIDLFYRNIESFLANTFRILRKITPDARWDAMVRDFVHRHASSSPYFVEIPQEFLVYLDEERDAEGDPPFLLELCHYEWVELALDVSEETLPPAQPDLDVMNDPIAVSPLAWPLQYTYPVHEIGPDYQPDEPPSEPSYLIVYRNRADRVRFVESNVVTARLLQLIGQGMTGSDALEAIAGELGEDRGRVFEEGRKSLEHLAECDIIAGVV